MLPRFAQRGVERVDRGAGHAEGLGDAFLLHHQHGGLGRGHSRHVLDPSLPFRSPLGCETQLGRSAPRGPISCLDASIGYAYGWLCRGETAMELRYLRYFVAVAQELNFTAAAHRLRLSQPSLSQQIRDLEQELKTPLFLRSSRQVELTAAGRAFLEHAHIILSQTERAAEQARAIGEGQIGTLDIGTTGSVLLGKLSSMVVMFSMEYQDITLRIHEMAPQDQEEALRERRVDVCFLRRPTDDPNVINELAWPARVGVVLPEGHLLATRDEVALAELRDERHAFLRLKDFSFCPISQGRLRRRGVCSDHLATGCRGLLPDQLGSGRSRSRAGARVH